jgi:hypothetical protein
MTISREASQTAILFQIEAATRQLQSSHPALAKSLALSLHPLMLQKLYNGLVLKVFTSTTLSRLSIDKIGGLIRLLVPDDIRSPYYHGLSRGLLFVQGLPLNERLQENLTTAEYSEALLALAKGLVTVAQLEALDSEQIKVLVALKLAQDLYSPEVAEGALLIRHYPELDKRLHLTLSPVRYEKILLGLSRKLFTPQELGTLNTEQIYQLLCAKKLLTQPSHFLFSGYSTQSVATQLAPTKSLPPAHPTAKPAK